MGVHKGVYMDFLSDYYIHGIMLGRSGEVKLPKLHEYMIKKYVDTHYPDPDVEIGPWDMNRDLRNHNYIKWMEEESAEYFKLRTDL